MFPPFDSPLWAHRRDVNSQNGEDGVLAEILRRLGVRDGWVVEAGAWDGVHLSNTFALLDPAAGDFRALYVEADPAKFEDLQKTAARLPAGKIVPVRAELRADEDTLGRLVAVHAGGDVLVDQDSVGPVGSDGVRGAAPAALAVLSIDIDSHDYDVWARFEGRPAVVVVEIDSGAHPLAWRVHGRDGWAGSTSFLPMLLLGARKGYVLAAHTGNMVFVRADLWPKMRMPEPNPMALFCRGWLAGEP